MPLVANAIRAHFLSANCEIVGMRDLREYEKRFNKAALEINEPDEQVIMMTFQAGLINPDLVFSLGKTPPTSMTDLLFKAQKYMNGEDTLMAKGLTGKRKKDKGTES